MKKLLSTFVIIGIGLSANAWTLPILKNKASQKKTTVTTTVQSTTTSNTSVQPEEKKEALKTIFGVK